MVPSAGDAASGAGGRLFDPAAPAWLAIRRGIGWVGREPGRQEGLVAGDEGVTRGRRKPRPPTRPRLVGGRLQLEEQTREIGGPDVLLLLLHEGQFAQMVDMAARVAAGGVRAIRRPPSVDAHPRRAGQDTTGAGGLAAARGLENAAELVDTAWAV